LRILIRTSKWATWARRLGSLALPLTIIPPLLHRERFITSDVFMIVVLVAALVALLALLVSLVALARLWHTGDRGWDRALSGLVLSLLCLAPFAWFGMLALRLPPATDIATISRSEMPLVFDPDTASMPAPRLLTPAQLETDYPNVKTRVYPLDALQTYGIVLRMIEARGWTVRLARLPADGMGVGRINAQVTTLPGWREEVVLRIAGTNEGASVDMRSASLNAEHDFGSNGTRIESFLVDLDNEITVLLRDNPNAGQPVDTELEAEEATAPLDAAQP
jgi:hypothetical protein